MIWFKRKPKPEPWDGTHRMAHLGHTQYFGDSPDDYTSGWRWQCSCGIGTSRPLGLNLAHTEAQAADQFISHRALHAELVKML